jgi:hypothetical protein
VVAFMVGEGQDCSFEEKEVKARWGICMRLRVYLGLRWVRDVNVH